MFSAERNLKCHSGCQKKNAILKILKKTGLSGLLRSSQDFFITYYILRAEFI